MVKEWSKGREGEKRRGGETDGGAPQIEGVNFPTRPLTSRAPSPVRVSG